MLKRRPSKELIDPGKLKHIKSSSDKEQTSQHDSQASFPDSGYSGSQEKQSMEVDDVSPIAAEPCYSGYSGSQEKQSMEVDDVSPIAAEPCYSDDSDDLMELPFAKEDEDSDQMIIDTSSKRFAEHCLHLKIKVGKEKSSLDSVLQPTCALLNSGGGVLLMKIDNYSELKSQGKSPLQELDKFWQGFEEKLKTLVKPLSYDKVFDRKIEQDEVFLFVKASNHWCTLEYNLFLSGDSQVSDPSFGETVELLSDKPLGKKKKFPYIRVHLDQLKSLPEQFKYKEKLGFHESKTVQFKNYTSKNPILHNNSHKEQDKSARQISAFANGSGGIILLGVEDDCTVLGQNMNSEGNSQEELKQRLDSIVNEMKWSCTPEKKRHWDLKFHPVQGREGHFVIAIYVAGVRGGVFTKIPKSYELRPGDDGKEAVYPVEFQEWKQRVLHGGNILQNESIAMKHLTEKFSRLTISSGVLLTVKGSVGRIRDSFFTVKAGCPVSPKGFESDLPESAQLVIRQIQAMSSKGRARALLVGSRSWLSCIKRDGGENLAVGGLICDLLLFNAELGGLHLFTLCNSEQEEQFLAYSETTAKALKKALVTDGGCHEKFYIINHVVPCCSPSVQIGQLSPDNRYPMEYDLRSSREKLNEILDSLVRLLAVVPSALSSKQGISFFNLLTKEQFKLLYQEIDEQRELWIKGAAGTGKTVVAVEFIKELLRRDSNLTTDEILYVCENRGLMQQISKLDLCQCVCRKTFMLRSDFSEVKHIIMDEVQSFRDEDRNEDGDSWLQKARKLVRQHSVVNPGFLWLFNDNKQINHWYPTGIPPEKEQKPSYTLTKVIRNSHRIFKYASKRIFENDAAVTMGHDFEGEEIVGYRYKAGSEESQISVLKSVVESLSTEGYRSGDIAILYGKEDCIPSSKLDLGQKIVDAEENDPECLVLSTFRKYSGLERPVVILVNIVNSLPHNSNSRSAFYCCATRAMVKLVLLIPKN